jgi:N-acetyl-anhydromuramyl-L-alanine amidase AmpD
MSYAYVQAWTDLGPARGPRLAITWHMAEGGNTVAYLAKPNPNDVSVHFVVEGTGRIVQMLPLDHMQSSIRTSAIRLDDDDPYIWAGVPVIYGHTAAHDVMGSWSNVVTTLGPNHASIGVEVEGFAKDGPNAKQADAMRQLFAYLAERFPGIKSLGHRDFASYKGCPGQLIPWDKLGGHAGETAMKAITSEVPAQVTVAAGTRLYALDGTTVIRTQATALDWRSSPFACGLQRAIYATVGTVRQLVLCKPSATRPVPVPDADAAYNAGLQAAAAAVAAVPPR